MTRRHVVYEGKDLGKANIHLPPNMVDPADPWLRPFFDPETKSLCFQKRDGTDLPFKRATSWLAPCQSSRPLLHLAHAEGLLDLVPGEVLPYTWTWVGELTLMIKCAAQMMRSGL